MLAGTKIYVLSARVNDIETDAEGEIERKAREL